MIREATIEDAAAIQTIYEPFVTSSVTSFEYKPPSVEEMALRIGRILETHPYLVYEDEEGKVLGFAYATKYKEREGYKFDCESSVYLSPQGQGKGIGGLLYEKLFEILYQMGIYKVIAGIAGDNPASYRIHKKFGFKPTENYEGLGYKLGQWIDVVWYLKELRSTKDVREPKEPIPYRNLNKNGLFK